MADIRHYSRPPITEAVIELRFEGHLSGRELERVRDRFKPRYSTIEQLQLLEVVIGERGALTPKLMNAGYKMTDKNALDILMVKTNTFGTIRLAPYENWETLRGTAAENWELFEKVLNTRKRVLRIGARFINRIDIPTDLLAATGIAEMFPTHIRLGPGIASETGQFSYRVQALHAGTSAKLTIQSAVLEQPALLENTSISLDTDAYFDLEIPQRIDEMWAMADKLREAKNDVFENSISDHLRAFFK